jgi:hypothetical protein
MEEKRQRGADKDKPHDIMEWIGQPADPSTHARLGEAIGRGGASIRLGARQRVDKAATVLQSVARKHPIINFPLDPRNATHHTIRLPGGGTRPFMVPNDSDLGKLGRFRGDTMDKRQQEGHRDLYKSMGLRR